MIDIIIQRTLSKSFLRCLEIGVGLVGFSESTREGNVVYRLRIANKKRLQEALQFIQACQRLRSKRVFVNGLEVGWQDMFKFVKCYSQKQSAGHNHRYCHGIYDGGNNLFGCQQTAGFEFGRHGRWDKDRRRWIFHKAKIKKALNEKIGHFCHCPAFDESRAHQIVDAMPASADPVGDPLWCFNAPLFRPIEATVHRIEIKYPRSVCVKHVLGISLVAQAVDLVDHLNRSLSQKRQIPFESVEYQIISVDVVNSIYDARLDPRGLID